MKFILLLLLAIGCGNGQFKVPTANPGQTEKELSDTLLKPYFESFKLKAACFNRSPEYSTIKLIIIWEGTDTAGKCIVYSDKSAIIQIDGPTWTSINEINKERLVYHELGHCYLGLEHIGQEFEPDIMTPTIREVMGDDYVAQYDTVIKELFSNEQTNCNFAYKSYTGSP